MKRLPAQDECKGDGHLHAEMAAIALALQSDTAFTEKLKTSPISQLSTVLSDEGFAGDAVSREVVRGITNAIADQSDIIGMLDIQQVNNMSLSDLEAVAPTLMQQFLRDIQAMDSTESASIASIAGGGVLKTWKRTGDRTPTQKRRAVTADALELAATGLLAGGIYKGIQFFTRPSVQAIGEDMGRAAVTADPKLKDPQYLNKPLWQEYEESGHDENTDVPDSDRPARPYIDDPHVPGKDADGDYEPGFTRAKMYNHEPQPEQRRKYTGSRDVKRRAVIAEEQAKGITPPAEENPPLVRFSPTTNVRQIAISEKTGTHITPEGKKIHFKKFEFIINDKQSILRPKNGNPNRNFPDMADEFQRSLHLQQDLQIEQNQSGRLDDPGLKRGGFHTYYGTPKINSSTTTNQPIRSALRNTVADANPRRIEREARTVDHDATRDLDERHPGQAGGGNDDQLIMPTRPHLGQSLDLTGLDAAADREAGQLVEGAETEVDGAVTKGEGMMDV